MRPMLVLVATLAAIALPAGAQSVNDVGLTMSGGVLTVIYGQSCGPVSCTTFPGGTVTGGAVRTVTHHAAFNTPYALVVGLPGPCFPFPGIANPINLTAPLTVSVGITASPSLTGACRQGAARYTLTMPSSLPGGIAFRLQSLGVSNSGQLAVGPAIEVITR